MKFSIKIFLALAGLLGTSVVYAQDAHLWAGKDFWGKPFEGDLIYVQDDQWYFFNFLDNDNGQYSEYWEDVLEAVPFTTVVNTFFTGDFLTPEIVPYNGKYYHVVGMSGTGGRPITSGMIPSVKIPFETRFIGPDTFHGSSLTDSLMMQPAVAHVGVNGFTNNTNLHTLQWQGALPPVCEYTDGTEVFIGDSEFEGKSGSPFEEVNPDCKVKIPQGSRFFYESHPAFSNFKNISEFRPDYNTFNTFNISAEGHGTLNVAYVGNGELLVLSGWSDSNSLAIPFETDGVKVNGKNCRITGIAYEAFKNSDLESIVIPEGVKYVCAEAFAGSKIKELTLPSTCLYAANRAFADMPDLKTVTMKATGKPVFAPDAFTALPDNTELITSADIVQTDAPWKEFSTISDIPGAAVEEVESGVDSAYAPAYDTLGQRVDNPAAGTVYIHNGKKFVAR